MVTALCLEIPIMGGSGWSQKVRKRLNRVTYSISYFTGIAISAFDDMARTAPGQNNRGTFKCISQKDNL